MTEKLIVTNNTQIILHNKFAYKRFTSGSFDTKTIKDFLYLDKQFNIRPLIIGIKRLEESPFKKATSTGGSSLVLVQRRFPENCTLSALTSQRKLTNKHIMMLAHDLFLFHSKTASVRVHNGYVSALFKNDINVITKNASHSSTIYRISIKLQQKIDNLGAVLDNRAKNGMIKKLHGDITLGNIFYANRRLNYLDFGHREKYRIDDVSKDVASLFLDIAMNKNMLYAKKFLREYIRQSRDNEAKDLVPFYALRILLLKAAIFEGYFGEKYIDTKESLKIGRAIMKFSSAI